MDAGLSGIDVDLNRINGQSVSRSGRFCSLLPKKVFEQGRFRTDFSPACDLPGIAVNGAGLHFLVPYVTKHQAQTNTFETFE